MAYFVQSDSGRMRSDPRCAMLAGTCRSMVSSDREAGRLPNVPSEPTMTSDLPLSLGHLPLGTMVPHFPKQLRQLVILVWTSNNFPCTRRIVTGSLLGTGGYDARGTTEHYFISLCRMA